MCRILMILYFYNPSGSEFILERTCFRKLAKGMGKLNGFRMCLPSAKYNYISDCELSPNAATS